MTILQLVDTASPIDEVLRVAGYVLLSGSAVVVVSAAFVLVYVLLRYISWRRTPLRKLPGPSGNKDFWLGVFPDVAYLSFMEGEKKWFDEVGWDTKVLHTSQIWGKSSLTILDKDLAAKIFAASPVSKDGLPPRFPRHKPNFKVILGGGLLALEDEDWKRHRKIMEPFFNRNFLRQSLGAAIPSKLKRVIACWNKVADTQHEICIHSHASALALDIIGEVALDHNFRGINMIEEWSKNLTAGGQLPEIKDKVLKSLTAILQVDLSALIALSMQPPFFLVNMVMNLKPRLTQGRKTLDDACDEIIANAMKDKNTDKDEKSLLHLMLKSQDNPDKGKRLSKYEIKGESKTLIMAGHETAAAWINWTVFCFCKYPDLQEKVYKNVMENVSSESSDITMDEIEQMDYMNAFLQEVLRLYPPLGQHVRVSFRPEVMEGVEVPVGTHLRIPNFLIQRHPKYWPDAEKLKPERWINPTEEEKAMRRSAFMPFGGGPRLCVGQLFAYMEVRMTMAYLIREFRFKGTPSQLETKFYFESLITMRSKPDFKILIQKRR